jgi:hypothetical protein
VCGGAMSSTCSRVGVGSAFKRTNRGYTGKLLAWLVETVTSLPSGSFALKT